jgi:hypothetical protein
MGAIQLISSSANSLAEFHHYLSKNRKRDFRNRFLASGCGPQ